MSPGATIEISGNLVRNPELRFTPGGHAVCTFTIAVTPRERGTDGTWTDSETQYWNVTAWRSLAENVADSLVRGDPVTVTGRVTFRTWETKPTDGSEPVKRHQHEVTADSVSVPLAFHTVTIRKARRNRPTGENEPADMESASAK